MPQSVRPEFEMRDSKTAASCSAEPSSIWSDFKNIRIIEEIETTCISLETDSFGTELERTILNWDIKVRYSHFYLSTDLLITTLSTPILEHLSGSRKTSCFFV